MIYQIIFTLRGVTAIMGKKWRFSTLQVLRHKANPLSWNMEPKNCWFDFANSIIVALGFSGITASLRVYPAEGLSSPLEWTGPFPLEASGRQILDPHPATHPRNSCWRRFPLHRADLWVVQAILISGWWDRHRSWPTSCQSQLDNS